MLVVVNKHNTTRVESFWFIIYYRLVMHGNSNIKFGYKVFCELINAFKMSLKYLFKIMLKYFHISPQKADVIS